MLRSSARPGERSGTARHQGPEQVESLARPLLAGQPSVLPSVGPGTSLASFILGDAHDSTQRTRKRRPVASAEKAGRRGVNLTDTVWERLQLEATWRKTTVSAIAGDVLERNLPRLRIERVG
jgi:hypothetical protein